MLFSYVRTLEFWAWRADIPVTSGFIKSVHCFVAKIITVLKLYYPLVAAENIG